MNKITRLIALFSISALALSSCGNDGDDTTPPTPANPILTETCKVNTVSLGSTLSTFVYNTAGKLTSINVGGTPAISFTHAGDSIVYLDDNRTTDPADFTREVCRVSGNQVAAIRSTTRSRGDRNTVVEEINNNVFNRDANGRINSVTITTSGRVLDEDGQVVVSNIPASTGTVTMTYNAAGALTTINLPANAIDGTPAITANVTPSTINARNARIPNQVAVEELFNSNVLLASPLINLGEKLIGTLAYSVGPFSVSTNYTFVVDSRGNATSMTVTSTTPFGETKEDYTISYNCQ